MGERDEPHSYHRSLSLVGELLTHGHGDEELDGEVYEEVKPREEAAARSSHDAATTAYGGGGCPWEWRPLASLLPW